MGKKKQFINKKTSQHFHVVHRSQRDPKYADPDATKFVLLSSNAQQEYEPEHKNAYSEEEEDDDLPDLIDSKPSQTTGCFGKDLINEFGFKNDGYDYSKHMKEIGHGQLYNSAGQFGNYSEDLLSRQIQLPNEVLPSQQESERLLESITISDDVMESDLREALNNDQAFEEIDDHFITQATSEEIIPMEGDEITEDGKVVFDYDAHIAKLLAAADGIPKHAGDFDDSDEEFFIEDEDENTIENDEEKAEEQRLLDEMFEKAMVEYDDDHIGELDIIEEETRGQYELDGALLDSIVDDYKNIQQELLDEEGKVGNPLRSGNNLAEILAECAERLNLNVNDVDNENEIEEPVPEEDPFLLADYLASKKLNEQQWDCETIVSTYSTLDNHPTLLDDDETPKQKKKRIKEMEKLKKQHALMNMPQITLSRKTGMPLGILDKVIEEDIDEEINDEEKEEKELLKQLHSRKKHESKEEKKLRKQVIKQMKKERRENKKTTKEAFKEEEKRQMKVLGVDQGNINASSSGLTVFKY